MAEPPRTHEGDAIAIMRALDEAVRHGSSGSLVDAADAVIACLKARGWKAPSGEEPLPPDVAEERKRILTCIAIRRRGWEKGSTGTIALDEIEGDVRNPERGKL